MKELEDLLKGYDVFSVGINTFDQALGIIMKNISENDLIVITAKISAISSNVGYAHASEKLRMIEYTEGLKKYKSGRSFDGTHRFYKELPGGRKEYLILGLYYK